MTATSLTPQQLAQVQKFDEEYRTAVPAVNFEHYAKRRFGPWNPYWHLYNFVRMHRSDRPQSLLNVGCGTGADALLYAKMGYHVEGIDISPRAVDVARAAAAKFGLEQNATFTVQPAESLEFPDGRFDVVAGVNVLHHVDTFRAVPEIRRLLKPDGVAIFKEPLATPSRDRIRHSWIVTRVIPPGIKSIPKGTRHGDAEGEHMLTRDDFALFEENFDVFRVERWRVLACLSLFVANKPLLERCDWLMFQVMPFIRKFGDQAVLTARLPKKRTPELVD